jgi:hypothetical protein
MRRLWLVLVLAACGPKVNPEEPFVEEDDPRAGASIDEPREVRWEELPEAPPPEGPLLREGTIARASLIPVLDQGPGPILSHMEVSAELDGDRFLGWRLVAFDPKHRDFDGIDLAPGDVLVALNGVVLSKPNELQAVWDDLRTADAIVADMRRAGTRFQLKWTITD